LQVVTIDSGAISPAQSMHGKIDSQCTAGLYLRDLGNNLVQGNIVAKVAVNGMKTGGAARDIVGLG